MAETGTIALIFTIIFGFILVIVLVIFILQYSHNSRIGLPLRVVQGVSTDNSFTTDGNDIYFANSISSLVINKANVNLQGCQLYISNGAGTASLVVSGGPNVNINGNRVI